MVLNGLAGARFTDSRCVTGTINVPGTPVAVRCATGRSSRTSQPTILGIHAGSLSNLLSNLLSDLQGAVLSNLLCTLLGKLLSNVLSKLLRDAP